MDGCANKGSPQSLSESKSVGRGWPSRDKCQFTDEGSNTVIGLINKGTLSANVLGHLDTGDPWVMEELRRFAPMSSSSLLRVGMRSVTDAFQWSNSSLRKMKPLAVLYFFCVSASVIGLLSLLSDACQRTDLESWLRGYGWVGGCVGCYWVRRLVRGLVAPSTTNIRFLSDARYSEQALHGRWVDTERWFLIGG